MMNKLGFLSLILVGASVTMLGCESTTSTETAQTSQQVSQDTVAQSATVDATAQSATVDATAQSGAAVQADPTLQPAEPVQVSPMGDETQSPESAQ